MTLTTNGLNWLAQNAGSGNCFVSTGVNFKDADGVSDTGGTKDVVTAFVVADMVGKTTAKIIAGTSYAGVPGTSDVGFKTINDNTDLDMDDVAEAADREAAGGEHPQYCVGGTVCTPGTKRCKDLKTVEICKPDGSGWAFSSKCPTGFVCQSGTCVPEGPTPDKPVTGPMKVYVGGGSDCPQGSPDVTLDTTGAFAYFKDEIYQYIGVGGIEVHNLSTECRIHLIWEVRVWDGYGYTTCPLSAPEMKEINRYLAEAGSRPISLKMLLASETDTVWGSFEITPGMEGEKTICLSLWGNYSRQALLDELAAEKYVDKY